MRTRAQANDAIDVVYLASTLDLTQEDVQTLLDAPTPALVQSLFYVLTNKGEEYEALKAEKLKIEVELENTVRTSDSKVKAQKATVTRHAKEIEELRTKLSQSDSARETLAAELAELKSSTTGTSVEATTLRQRIETLEASNRDALALVESKSTEKDRVASELSEQFSKLLALRKNVSELEDQNQALQNAASSQKFREQSLQQEIEQLKRNVEWHADELRTRNQEHKDFRKERNARVSTIQRELEDSNAAVETLQRTESTLRQRLEELQSKADEAFSQVASMEEEAIRKQQDFRTELESTKRLARLHSESAETHKKRLNEVQQQVEQIKEDAADEMGRLQAEIETERADKDDAERKVAELELSVERLEQQQSRLSRPGTPMRNGGAEPSTPHRFGTGLGSPAGVPGSLRKSVGGLTFSQLYSKCTQAQEDLDNERRRTQELTKALDELIDEMENRKPEAEELRSEMLRLEGEVLEFSRLLDEANANRDTAVRNAEVWEGEASARGAEVESLRQSQRDTAAQLKLMVVELSLREQGLEEMSADERFELEKRARGDVDDEGLNAMTNTGRLISERLVLFRNVSELIEKNEQLLRLTREIGEKMEGEEAREKARRSAAEIEEVDNLRRQVTRYRDELESTATQISTYVKERDLYRRMVQHRGTIPPDADINSIFGQSIAPATPMRGGLEPPPTPGAQQIADLNKVLKEQQTFLDQFRNEAATDSRILKDQIDTLGREKSALQSELAGARAQLNMAASRYETQEMSCSSLRTENKQLQTRSQQMAQMQVEQDRRITQIAEDLIEARSTAESLRHESTNTKAERDIFKRSETRLNEDNERLREERSRLNKLVTDLQTMQNERELTDSESRRRLQGRVESLESELSDTKRKLETELEENKRASLRREFEEGQTRTRVDDLMKSLGNVREELVAAKTTRDQLQSRVDELKIDLRAAEEKVTALQPRPTPRIQPEPQTQQNDGDEEEMTTEQRLSVEISDLRRDLEYARNDLENTKRDVEMYKGISQAAEEELARFTETADQYKEDTESLLAEKDAKVNQLQQRIEDLSSELSTTNSELSELRTNADNNNRLLSEQRASFEADMTRLRDDADRYTEERKLYQADLKAQAEIAQQAQQSYEDELLKHAEAAKALQTVRKEYGDLREQVASTRAEAEAAKINLERAEDSWQEQVVRFELELGEANRRRYDIDEQNKLLHKQMEAFSSELATLRQGRAAAVTGTPSEGAVGDDNPASSTGNFQELINYLRREKEIVDVQYEMTTQEAKRLQQRLDYAEGQLEETKQKLADERRQSAEKANSEGSTTRLMQTINELNLYRESSITLRNEAKQARERLEEKAGEVERLLTEIGPLRGRIDELEADMESKDGELKLLQDDRDHWRDRTQNIISKYDRIDPAELEELKKQLEATRTENEGLLAAQAPLQETINSLQARLEGEQATSEQVQAMQQRLDKFREQAKEQDRKRQARIKELTEEKNTLSTELDASRASLAAATAELEETKKTLEEVQISASAKIQADDDVEEGQVHEDAPIDEQNGEHAALQSRLTEAEANSIQNASRAEALSIEIQTLQARIQDLEGQNIDLKQQLTSTQSSNAEGPRAVQVDDAELLEKLKQDLATAQQEVEALRANATTTPAQDDTTSMRPSGADKKSLADQVAEEVAKQKAEMEASHAQVLEEMERSTRERIEKLKETLKERLKDERAKIRSSVQDEAAAEHAQQVQKIQNDHKVEIQKLNEAHAAEIARLGKDGNAAISHAGNGSTSINLVELTNAQIKELMQTNPAAKSLFTNNLKAQIEKQTSPLNAKITAKDEEITALKVRLDNMPITDGNANGDTISRAELEKQLAAAKTERETAVRNAIENAEKKAKVQLSQRDIANAKLAVVRQAAKDTPEEHVQKVWAIAEKARPAQKPTPAPAAQAPTEPKSLPQTAQPQSPANVQTPEQLEQQKLRQRQERFGAAEGGSFGRPSITNGPGTPPNPQAPEFKPAAAEASNLPRPGVGRGSGIPQPGGRAGASASMLPRGGQQARQASGSGPAAPSSSTTNGGTASRGGLGASGLPRGGQANRGNRGGRGGANAGQKRQNDGSDRNDDGKRMRSGAGPDGNGA